LRWIQRIIGFGLGFFFAQPASAYVTDFLTRQSVEIPSQVPTLLSFLLAGGTVGLILAILLLLMGLNFLAKIMTFVSWLLFGILIATVVTAMGFHIPNVFDLFGWEVPHFEGQNFEFWQIQNNVD